MEANNEQIISENESNSQNIINYDKYSFLDDELKNNSNKMMLFDDAINQIKTNIATPYKSSKISIIYVIYKLLLNDKISTRDQMINEINDYLQYMNNNFHNYSQNLGKFTLSHKFLKFSNNYLLEKIGNES